MSYVAGWGRNRIELVPRGHAMQGYGTWTNRAWAEQSPLYARAFYIEHEGSELFFCCLDLGYITHAMRVSILAALTRYLGSFPEENLVLTCTHTHSGPGGCSQDVLYNVVTPGFVPEHIEKITEAAVQAMKVARDTALPTVLKTAAGRFEPQVPVAWNRSLRAYNSNPEVSPLAETQTHLALDRNMSVLGFYREGKLQALISFFGVHATCVGNTNQRYDADNKGYAACHAEKILESDGVSDAVAIFAQATAGDVSPHYHGPGEKNRRRGIRAEQEYEYARRNGELQSELALAVAREQGEIVDGAIDAILSYADFSRQKADPGFCDGNENAFTSEPCHGTAFFRGTPVDGPGMPAALGLVSGWVADVVRTYRLSFLNSEESRTYYRDLYEAQGPKKILLEAGRKKILGSSIAGLPLPSFADPLLGELKRQAKAGAVRHSDMVPHVLPLQIVRIGGLALVCCPGEFTTIAGRRLVDVLASRLRPAGVTNTQICTYCNDYMGYVTTAEEYRRQCYEGGHTVYGQWTLAAFQTRFAELADWLKVDPAERKHDRLKTPSPPPAEELALRSGLPVPD